MVCIFLGESMGFVGGSVTLAIDKERIGVLIGEKGRVKKRIEELLDVKIEVDSKTGEVKILPKGERPDPLKLMKARDIVRAISYGFNPDVAMLLADDDMFLEVIDLKQHSSGRREDIIRIAGRVIGEKGKARRMIEELTGAHISIYRQYVAIIGNYDQVRIAKTAVEMLINGRQHATVYKYLVRARREMKLRGLGLWYGGTRSEF